MIEAGNIVAVGRNEKIRATRVVDGGGRLVTPGLIESQAHVGRDLPTACKWRVTSSLSTEDRHDEADLRRVVSR